jgi:general secretion pathway protein E
MIVDDAVRAQITQSTDAKTIKKAAVEHGMQPLRVDGARKVLDGVTSIEEVLRATEEEGVLAQI